MAYVVTFEDFTPPSREDTNSWQFVRIEESESEAGPFVAIDEIALPGTDPNPPSSPSPWSFTTELATLESGWYRVIYVDVSLDESLPTEPIHNSPAQEFDYLPAVQRVGAILRTRTRLDSGELLGTFSPDTEPTANQVHGLIHEAALEVVEITGVNIPEELWRNASSVIALGAALLVEMSYFTEQVQTDRSPYDKLERKYKERLKTLALAVTESTAGDDFGSSDADKGPSYGDFPETGVTMESPM